MAQRSTPLIIGVSGHRDVDPDNVPAVSRAVTAFFDALKASVPNTPIRLMVGMAEGADLLVAQLALDRGLAVDAVLPMPLERYAADFSPANLQLLQTLLQRVDVRHVELPLPVRAPEDAGTTANLSGRDVFYVNLRDYLIRCSALLLAVWDGESSPLPGGTADTVLRFLGARSNEDVHLRPISFVDRQPDSALPGQLVYWVPACRSSGTAPETLDHPCYLAGIGEALLARCAEMPHEFAHQLRGLDTYNREFEELQLQFRFAFTDSLMGALPGDMPLPHRAPLDQVDSEYGKADALAMFHQRRSELLFKLFGWSTFSMGLLYLLYEKFFRSQFLLFTYLVVLLSGIGVFHRVRKHRWFSKHLSYRVLAETMRVRFFLRLGTAEHLVNANELIYLSGIDQFEGFSWINLVLRAIEPLDASTSRPEVEPQQLACVDRAWVEDQESYFGRKVARLEVTSYRLGRLRGMLFVLIVMVILVLALFPEFTHHTAIGKDRNLADLLTFTIGLVGVVLGVWELYQNKMATRELLWQYRNQLAHFMRARTRLARPMGISGRKEILADLGKDSLMESYLWTIHRYHREHEPPSS